MSASHSQPAAAGAARVLARPHGLGLPASVRGHHQHDEAGDDGVVNDGGLGAGVVVVGDGCGGGGAAGNGDGCGGGGGRGGDHAWLQAPGAQGPGPAPGAALARVWAGLNTGLAQTRPGSGPRPAQA